MAKKFTIRRQRKPKMDSVNEELQYFCDSLGLFGTRDKDKSCFRMFVVLLREGQGLSSDEISERVGLSRGTVVHHLHKLINSGLVVKENRKYVLRVHNLSDLLDEIQRDILATMDGLKDVAENIDDRLQL